MRSIITKSIGFLLALVITLTGFPVTKVQAAAKPVIKSSQATIKKNSCTVTKGKKIKLVAKSGKTNITQKGIWKSSNKMVATVSKKGVLTAKNAGTTYITIKYKKKTSTKLKVVVKKEATPTPAPDDTPGAYTITYKINSTNKSDKLSGPSTQSVSGEILKFSSSVTPASGKKFLGWYTSKTGGKRIYETYVPTQDMTLYAHYTTDNAQWVAFNLGCNYGADNVTFMGFGDGYDWDRKVNFRGPVLCDDIDSEENMKWFHQYVVTDKKSFVIDNLPEPSIPGYEFKGWYTVPQNFTNSVDMSGENVNDKVQNGQEIDVSVTKLYARFSKKLTISFDDFHGGTYPDIVIDTYGSISDAGHKLPTLDIPGTTFLGWSLQGDMDEGAAMDNMITNDTVFSNIVQAFAYFCSDDGSMQYHYRDLRAHWIQEHGDLGAYNDWIMYREVDHITLYPIYKHHRIYVGFDPDGGKFSSTATENIGLRRFDEDEGEFKAGLGYFPECGAGCVYGEFAYYPGHEGQMFWWEGNNRTIPVVTKQNYRFDKWVYQDDDGKEQELTPNTILTKSTIMYAKWLPGKCNIVFNPGDGTFTDKELTDARLDGAWRYTVTTESTVAKDGMRLPIPYSPEGREFLGWFTKDGEPFTEDTKVLGNTSVSAKWGVLPKDLPVILKFDAGGGTFKDGTPDLSETGMVSKEITRSSTIGQFPELEERPDYVFAGWYVMKADATASYQESDYLQTVNANNRINESWINDKDEVLIMVKWRQIQHVNDIYVLDNMGIDPVSIDKDNNHYNIEYNGKDKDAGLEFIAVLLPESADDNLKNVKWTTSDPNILYIKGSDTIYSDNVFYRFYFGDNTGDVVLTATSVDNPIVKFDVHVTVAKSEQK